MECNGAHSFINAGLVVCHTGRDETMQAAKPSFLEYFEQKEKEVNNHNDGGRRGEGNADNRKLPGEGDLEVVSMRLTLQTTERESKALVFIVTLPITTPCF